MRTEETLETLNSQVVRAKYPEISVACRNATLPGSIHLLSGSSRAASSTHVRLQAPGHADYIDTDPIGSPGSKCPEWRA